MSARKRMLAKHKPSDSGFVLDHTEIEQLFAFADLEECDYIIQNELCINKKKADTVAMSICEEIRDQENAFETIFPGQSIHLLHVVSDREAILQSWKLMDMTKDLWKKVHRISMIVICEDERMIFEFVGAIANQLPWHAQTVRKTERHIKGSISGEEMRKSIVVIDTTADFQTETALAPEVSSMRMMKEGVSPVVFRVEDAKMKDVWAIQVHRDLVKEVCKDILDSTPTALGSVIGADRYESRVVFPRISDAKVEEIVKKYAHTSRFSAVPLQVYTGESFREAAQILEGFTRAAHKETESPFMWQTLTRVALQHNFKLDIQLRGANKARLGFATTEDFTVFMDKAIADLREKGYVFKIERSGQYVNDEDDAESFISDSTITSSDAAYITDVPPWLQESELKEMLKDIENLVVCATFHNVGMASKKTWKLKAPDVADKSGRVVKTSSGEMMGIIISAREYLERKQESQSKPKSNTYPSQGSRDKRPPSIRQWKGPEFTVRKRNRSD